MKNHITLCFRLSMPNSNSWNGKWSGEGKTYAIFKKFSGLKGIAKAQELLDERSFYYSFGDGWGASVNIQAIAGPDLAKMRRLSSGFCGYDWMVESILKYGKIINDSQIPQNA